MSHTLTAASRRRIALARRIANPTPAAGAPAGPDEPPLRIRLVGTPEHVAAGVAALRLVLDVAHVSQPHAGRGHETPGHIRVYVHASPAAGVEALARVVTRG